MTMKMRELEARTGVDREMIRVFLRLGLIPEPERPARNVANYNEDHVRAVMAVRDLQRNSSMTLKAIGEVLNGDPGQSRVDASAFQHLEELVATRVGVDVQPILLSSLVKAYPEALSDAQVMSEHGIIDLLESPDGYRLSITDARMVTIWSEMRHAGFNEELGFGPEILTFYIGSADIVAESESRLFLERVEGIISEERAAEMLQIGLRQMQDFWGLLRLKKFLAYINREDIDRSAARARRAPAGDGT